MFLSNLVIDYLQERLNKVPYIWASNQYPAPNTTDIYVPTFKGIEFFVGDKVFLGDTETDYIDGETVDLRKVVFVENVTIGNSDYTLVRLSGSPIADIGTVKIYNLGVDIQLGSFQKFIDETTMTTEVSIPNSYRFENEEFIPAMAEDFLGEYVPLQDITSIEISVPLTFIVKVDLLNRALLKLNRFSRGLVGRYDILNHTDDGINPTYTAVFNTGLITPNGEPYYLNGINVIELGLGINIEATTDVYYGNEVKYYLGDALTTVVVQDEVKSVLTILTSNYVDIEAETPVGSGTAHELVISGISDSNGVIYSVTNVLTTPNNTIKLDTDYQPQPPYYFVINGSTRTDTDGTPLTFGITLNEQVTRFYTITYSISNYVEEQTDIDVPHYVELNPISRGQDRNNNLDTFQKLNQPTAKSYVKDNIWNCELTVFYKKTNATSLYHNLVKYCEGYTGFEQNKEWYFKVEYPTFTMERKVVIEGISVSPQPNEKVFITMTLKEMAFIDE